MTRHFALLTTVAVLVAAATLPAAASATVLGLHHVGPLRLGMTRTAAISTGWLAHRGRGCPLGGPPVPIIYRLDGRRAPQGLRGVAQFEGGRLTNLSFTRGIHTETGVTVGVTSATQMASRYRQAGFTVRSSYERTFGGTFVNATRSGSALGAFATGPAISILAIPRVLVCD
jgi:hypothetical protein